MPKWKTSVEERFWSKVRKGPGCWEWKPLGNRSDEYGQFYYYGQKMSSHRSSWMIHHGDIPDGMYVLHRCDNRKCVNPDHLFIGTQKDNMDDMDSKGRKYRERKSHCQKGHALSFENTATHVFQGITRRTCRKCKNKRNREFYWRKKTEQEEGLTT